MDWDDRSHRSLVAAALKCLGKKNANNAIVTWNRSRPQDPRNAFKVRNLAIHVASAKSLSV